MNQHILLVEDDPAIATSLRITFKREGWQLTWLDTASQVLSTLVDLDANLGTSLDIGLDTGLNRHRANADVTKTPLTAIILDVGLPDGDGLNLCQSIRQSNHIGDYKNLPIIFLTARSDEIDRILGLEMGGDDYCAKPFSPREVVARLKAIWRRDTRISQQDARYHSTQTIHSTPPYYTLHSHSSQNGDQPSNNQSTQQRQSQTQTAKSLQNFVLDSGNWQYHADTYRLYWQKHKLELSNTERKLLLYLIQHPSQVFSREQLLSVISDHPDHRLARTIDSHIKSIRRQLAQIDANTEVIYTHRGIGYGLCSS